MGRRRSLVTVSRSVQRSFTVHGNAEEAKRPPVVAIKNVAERGRGGDARTHLRADAAVVHPIKAVSTEGLWRGFDVGLIDGAVNGSGYGAEGLGSAFRRLQTGENPDIEVGRTLALRANDGALATASYVPSSSEPGQWQTTPSCLSTGGTNVHWRNVRPFGVPASSTFRLGPPPAMAAGLYARDFTEVARVGDELHAAEVGDEHARVHRVGVNEAARQQVDRVEPAVEPSLSRQARDCRSHRTFVARPATLPFTHTAISSAT